MSNDRKSFLFYLEWGNAIKELPNDVRLEIYDAIVEYAQSGKLPDLKPYAKIAFTFIQGDIDRDSEKYHSMVERNKENIKKRWSKDTSGKSGIPKNTKNTDNDNDNDDGNDDEDGNENGDGKKKGFAPPTVDDVARYFKQWGYCEESAKKAFEYYNVAGWKDSKGTQVRNWKQKMQAVWFKPENKIETEKPKYNPEIFEREY